MDKNLVIKARRLITLSYVALAISAVSFILGFWFWSNLFVWFGITIVGGITAKLALYKADQITEDLLTRYR